jgi:hypothetical protein
LIFALSKCAPPEAITLALASIDETKIVMKNTIEYLLEKWIG